jgi:hypothetical protein
MKGLINKFEKSDGIPSKNDVFTLAIIIIYCGTMQSMEGVYDF